MERTLVRELAGHDGRSVRLCGWAYDIPPRRPGPELICTLRDHTGAVDLAGGGLVDQPPVAPGSAIEVIGTVAGPPGSATGRRVVVADRLRVVGPALGPLPVDAASSLDDRLDWRYLDLRRPENRLMLEVQTTVEHAMREWWRRHQFVELHSPKLRAMPNQSGRELFTVQYFDGPAYLVQSPQFYKQMAMTAGLDRVFEIGPVFRANPLTTARHDTEFTSVDVEVSWIDSHEDVMTLEEQWLRHVIAAVESGHGTEVERLFGRRVVVPDVPFPRITLTDARRVLADSGHRPSGAEGDLDAEGERLLGAHIAAELGHELVFVTEYPETLRPFYHMRVDDESPLTRSFDLLWNGLEVTTGAQREHRHDRLVAQAGRNPARVEAIRTYLDFFRYGAPPHGGFGVGLTRVLMCLLGVGDVREVTFLPRSRNRLTP